ncbi:MAG: L,D-transpeptidase family protein [Rhodospirillaceae bacterium]
MIVTSKKIKNLLIGAVGAFCALAVASAPSVRAASANPAPSVNTGVVDQWREAISQRLAGTDPAAAPVAASVGAGPSLKLGAIGERVDRLAAQLTARGLLPAGAYAGVYDAAVETAVRAFQTAEGLLADGAAGAGTIEALDRDPATIASILKATLAEMKSFESPREFFLVNIPSQTGYLIKGDKVMMAMRVAVGRPSRPTPLLADRITDVILNPTWTAPTTVLAKDKLPNLRRTGHPGIEGATIYVDGLEVDPAMVEWSAVTAERLRIVQSPGDQNALGRIKFNLTNGESIYLHDTNDHSVFDRQGRAISSGCVRLGEPRRLADFLLGREGWSSERIEDAIDADHTRAVGLGQSLPVRIVYWQATVDDAGAVRLHRDVYNHNSAPVVASSVPVAKTASAPAAKSAAASPVLGPVAVASQIANTELTQPRSRVLQVGAEAVSIPVISRASVSAQVTRPEAEMVAVKVTSPERMARRRAACDGSCSWGLY